MRTPVLYRIGRAAGRILVGFYFRRVEIAGGGNIPKSGPAIFAANHPQSLTDALVLGLATPRVLHFLAHSGLFRSPVSAFFLRGAGVIPVHRKADAGGAGNLNLEMFRDCRLALEGGEAIAVFPEGVSRQERRLQNLKTGTARIALESEAPSEFALGVRVIPVGINFESRWRFRSRVLVNVGVPIPAAKYREAYGEDPRGAVGRMTDELQEQLGGLVVNLGRNELEHLVEDAEEIYRDELLDRPDFSISGESRFSKEQTLSREIARAVDHFDSEDPELIWQLRQSLREYRRKRDRLRISEKLLRQDADPGLRKEVFRLLALILLGGPFWAYGTLWNILPYRLTGRLAKRKTGDPTKVHWFQLSYGAIIYSLYYPPLLWLAHGVLGTGGMLAFAASLIPTGFFARWFARLLHHRRETVRYAWLAAFRGYYLNEMRRLRRHIVHEMDVARERYVEEVGR
jgi:glycerol-3-phosphate O-acyltransferase/dihydroxyacetone phosphate acyltransferase